MKVTWNATNLWW